MTPMHLRLEAADGRDGEEYRVYEGHVEVRQLESKSAYDSAVNEDDEFSWRRISPEELTAHVNAGTVLAEWLKKRLGWRRLLRACVGDEDLYMFDHAAGNTDRAAA